MNLALAYAEDRKCRTLLIDADLRRPSVSCFIDPQAMLGLSEVLAATALWTLRLVEMSDSRLWARFGAPSEAPLELLQKQDLGK
jgi:hypothetical protein